MNRPSSDALFAALEATWPPRSTRIVGPWTIRDGAGGGQRVSAATANGTWTADDIPLAEHANEEIGQRSLFMLRDHEGALDKALEECGYRVKDPVTHYVVRCGEDGPVDPSMILGWPSLNLQNELWALDDVGPERIGVMERASNPKTAIFLRDGQNPVGTVFVSIAGEIGFLHALFVHHDARGLGFGRRLIRAASGFVGRHGATWLALAVTDANKAARSLYESEGMTAADSYHYRVRE